VVDKLEKSMSKIADIEGIGPAYAEKLKSAGIDTVEELLEAGASKKGREDIAAKSEITEKLILEWVNRADLARIKGIGSEYADLLEASGVDSVPELAQRNAANLTAKMEEVNAAKSLVRRVPSESEVSGWIDQAKALPKVVTH
jgi:predicted flap endonuclease-1-like 5' DNA nuclease